MSWQSTTTHMRTRSGRVAVTLQGLREYEYPIEDVAHGLAMLCRYNGNVDKFFSVAQHCVHVSERVEHDGGSPSQALWALLHDSEEYIVGDMIAPVKALFPQFVELGDFIRDQVMLRHIGEDHASHKPVDFDALDVAVRDDEAAVLFDDDGLLALRRRQRAFSEKTGFWGPSLAKRRFLERYEALTAALVRSGE